MIADLLLDTGAQPVIGHRGASGSAPENTLASFDLALEQGAEALEFDVRVTADGVPVVCHDPTQDRTTDQTGPIRLATLAQIRAADAGARFSLNGVDYPFRGREIRIPTLGEVLNRYRDVPLLIELKTVDGHQAIKEVLIGAEASGRVVLASFADRALAPFRGTQFVVGASRNDILRQRLTSWHLAGWRGRAVPQCFAVPYRYQDLIEVPTEGFIRSAHLVGSPVHVWTVNDPALAERLWGRGANGIITNFPGSIQRHRHQ